jgi:hypothetical protein
MTIKSRRREPCGGRAALVAKFLAVAKALRRAPRVRRSAAGFDHPRRTATPAWDSGSGPPAAMPGGSFPGVAGSEADRPRKIPGKIWRNNLARFSREDRPPRPR